MAREARTHPTVETSCNFPVQVAPRARKAQKRTPQCGSASRKRTWNNASNWTTRPYSALAISRHRLSVLPVRGNVGGWAITTIGIFRNGISGTPHVEDILVWSNGKLDFDDSEKLLDLPRLLDDASALSCGT
jgi:hypothetical protein